MREIKFRGYHSREVGKGYWTASVTLKDISEGFAGLNDADAVVQYTGLKDKNGKEIYEGDLVLVRDVRICEIVFHEQAGCWDLELRNALSSLSIGPVAPASWKYHVEIIGNIHENSDLIK